MESGEEIPSGSPQLYLFWLAMAQGREEDVSRYLKQAGYSNVSDAFRDLKEDVQWSAQELRKCNDIDSAVEMERLAAEIASYLNPN